MKSYLVGGAVRDALMGRVAKDRDFVVVGSTWSDMIKLGYEPVGADFPVFLHPETREEYALARRETKVGAGYTGFEFETGADVTLVEDLSRRDLTINSMALADDSTIVDPFGGRRDLKARVLRHTTAAFAEDPLRVVRLARFFERYSDFSVASETMQLASEIIDRGELDHLSDERFWRELEKVFIDGNGVRFFSLLFELGALQKVDFFRKLFGDDWSHNRLDIVLLTARAFVGSGRFDSKEIAHFFAAAIAPENVQGLFANVCAVYAYDALWQVRRLKEPVTATDIHNLLSSIRGYSEEKRTLRDLSRLMEVVVAAGGILPITRHQLMSAALAGRAITAEPFLHLQGKAIGEAVAAARIAAISQELNLNL